MNHDNSLAEHPVIRNLEDFDQNSGNWGERLLFNNRAWVVLACTLLTFAMAYQAFGISLNAAFEKMIPTKHPFIANYLDNRTQLGGLGNTLRIAIENKKGNIYDAAYLEVVKKVTDEMFLYPGVDRPYMKSLWTPAVRWTGVTEDGLDGGPVIPDDYDASPESVEQVRINVERSGEIGQLVAGNLKSSIVLVPLQEVAADTGKRIDYRDLSEKLEKIRSTYESDDLSIHITGFGKIVGDLIGGLQQVLIFFVTAALVCTAVLFWFTRCLRSTMLVVMCSMGAVIWLLGALPSIGFELDPYSILVPFLVFAIGMSHGAQKMNGVMQDIGRGTHKLIAARYTFRRLFLAGVTALLADGVGFAVLMLIDIKVIQDLAITASIGMAALIFTNLVLLPILLSYTGVSATGAARSLKSEAEDSSDKQHTKHKLWAFLDLFTQRKYALIAVVVSAVLGSAAFLVSLQLKIGDTGAGAPELRADSRYNRDNAFMVDNYSASSDTYVVMVKTPEYQCGTYNTILSVNELETQLRLLPGVESTNSLAALTKQASAGLNEGSLKWYDIPRSQDLLNALITRAPRELFNQNCNLLTLYVYLKDHKADTLDSVVAVVESFAKQHNSEETTFLSAAGNAGIEAATNIVVKRANVQMLILVYAAVIVLAFITFRSWQAVVCAVLPLMLTSALCEALMVYLNIGVKVATLPVIALGVGIGVDYALYMLTVMLSRLRNGDSLSEAYYQALVFTGRVVVLTGVTLGIAVATWGFSPIKFQADMGILLAFMFVWNMLGALILLPALAHFLMRPATQKNTAS
ncbi:efflux RND transporter permease subunit [Ferribacterium limneticum]|uniref:efflux RND transporter permease subunit n=1 Tax=Ferribacterium limneticum TaxID=76259 RepID=UPI001CFBB866|nr:MMPL family transporter [Ferribacterium limneticum]UCV27062.1 RND family transporter [Ferribacterium limneticum]UCV30979.1 RND family transporter [Ferribacterium limneticum]